MHMTAYLAEEQDFFEGMSNGLVSLEVGDQLGQSNMVPGRKISSDRRHLPFSGPKSKQMSSVTVGAFVQ